MYVCGSMWRGDECLAACEIEAPRRRGPGGPRPKIREERRKLEVLLDQPAVDGLARLVEATGGTASAAVRGLLAGVPWP